jgi:hypothetical protein
MRIAGRSVISAPCWMKDPAAAVNAVGGGVKITAAMGR